MAVAPDRPCHSAETIAAVGKGLLTRSASSLGCCLLFLTGCGLFQEEEVVYLKKAMTSHATQEDVKRRLGIPQAARWLPNGETAWTYQVWTNTGGDLNGPGESYCDEYRLRFDRDAILRDWTHQGC